MEFGKVNNLGVNVNLRDIVGDEHFEQSICGIQ
jgi:hypothetical protein